MTIEYVAFYAGFFWGFLCGIALALERKRTTIKF